MTPPRKYPLRENAFSELTPEATYWVGFLMADGCIGTNGSIRISLKTTDRGHLDKFMAFVGTERPIYPSGSTCVQLHLSSRQICSDLIELGVIPRKSYVPTRAKYPVSMRVPANASWSPFSFLFAVLPVCYQRQNIRDMHKKVSRSGLRQYLCGFHAIACIRRWVNEFNGDICAPG